MAHNNHDPYNAPPLRGLGPVKGTLRVFVALQCWGYAAARLHFHSKSALARVLEKEFYLPATQTGTLEMMAAIALVLIGMSCLLRPTWLFLLPLSLGNTAYVASKAWLGEGTSPAIVFASHVAMMWSPLILAAADVWPGHRKFSLGYWIAIVWMLRIAICATFIAGGLQGLMESHQGGDLVRVAAGTYEKFARENPSQIQAKMTLAIVSALQLGAGLALLLKRSREATAVAAIIGILVAASYSIGLGMAGYPRALIHLNEGGLAIALGLFWSRATHEGEWTYVPDIPLGRQKASAH